MRRWTAPTALVLLAALSACGSDPDLEEDPVADGGETAEDGGVVVPVDLTAELVDADGSVLGGLEFSDSEAGNAEVAVDVAGMTAGFHPMYLLDVGDCGTASPADVVAVLPPLLVLESGIGAATTLVGPMSLDDLADGGAAIVVGTETTAGPADLGAAPEELPGFRDVGSAAACGAVPG